MYESPPKGGLCFWAERPLRAYVNAQTDAYVNTRTLQAIVTKL